MSFDVETIRKSFPLIWEDDTNLHYLDSAATAQKPNTVIDCIDVYYQQQNAAVHRGTHKLSADATIAMEEARATIGKFINTTSYKEVVFTKGTTESINLIANSWGRSNLKAGDEIIISEMEHHANIVPWQMVASELQILIKVWPITVNGELDLDTLDQLISDKTRLIAISHISNVLGTQNPVKEICQLAKSYHIVTMIDGAQAVMHQNIDVQDLGCDFYVFSGHKLYGPTGIGILWARESILASMPPWQGGGAMIDQVDLYQGSTWADIPTRFEAGTPHVAGILGLARAVEFVTDIGIEAIAEHEDALMNYALAQLASIDHLIIYGPQYRTGVISFNLGELHAFDVGSFLDSYGVAIRTGHHCAMPLMKHYEVASMCRASIAVYTNKADVDALVAGLRRISRLLRSELA